MDASEPCDTALERSGILPREYVVRVETRAELESTVLSETAKDPCVDVLAVVAAMMVERRRPILLVLPLLLKYTLGERSLSRRKLFLLSFEMAALASIGR